MSFPALLLRPDVIAALTTAMELFFRNLLRKVGEMDDAELDAFIAEQKQRKADHDTWLADH